MAQDRFTIPDDIISQQDTYGDREVGITHPDTAAHIKLLDNGDIQLIAADGLGMVFHVANRSVTIVADHINFITKDFQGMRWNKRYFNNQAIVFNEPAFHPVVDADIVHTYSGAHHYFPPNGGN